MPRFIKCDYKNVLKKPTTQNYRATQSILFLLFTPNYTHCNKHNKVNNSQRVSRFCVPANGLRLVEQKKSKQTEDNLNKSFTHYVIIRKLSVAATINE